MEALSTTAIWGRSLIGLYFVFFGLWNIKNWRPTLDCMIQKKLPAPQVLLIAGIGCELLFGLFLILGFGVQLAAMMLTLFTLISICIFHGFWNLENGEIRRLNMIIFVTNVTMTLGGLLLLI